MNPEEHHEDLLSSSTTALRSLTISSETADRNVRDAAASLAQLLTKVSASREARQALHEAERAYTKRNEKALSELNRVDQEIVAAKVGAVELFEERDQVRRDLARAKAALEEIEQFEKEEGGDSSEVPDRESQQSQAEKVQAVEDELVEALSALRGYEEQLLVTTEEVEEVRKRKETLQGKLNSAQGEW